MNLFLNAINAYLDLVYPFTFYAPNNAIKC